MTMATETTKRQRSCIACGTQAGKATLHRIVRAPQGGVAFDATGRAPGRGAYVCSEACFATACKTKKLERALKTKIDHDELERIAAEVSSALREA
ncbi:MAG: YlxR family protein [Gordonibacter sp.]